MVDSHLKRGSGADEERVLNAKLDNCCAFNALQSGLCLIVWDKDYSGLLLFEAWNSQLFEVYAHFNSNVGF